mmetsp:Transcript_11845/g.24230  ORF Transcript_11845/g.24230 Transcript_11845/m.24230 type:complete len:99 (+) Transcript_11845:348-644(+)
MLLRYFTFLLQSPQKGKKATCANYHGTWKTKPGSVEWPLVGPTVDGILDITIFPNGTVEFDIFTPSGMSSDCIFTGTHNHTVGNVGGGSDTWAGSKML